MATTNTTIVLGLLLVIAFGVLRRQDEHHRKDQ